MSLLLAAGADDPESRLRAHDESLLDWIEDDGWHPDEANRFVDDFVLHAQPEAIEDAHDDYEADAAPQLFDAPAEPDPNPLAGYELADDGDDDDPDTALRYAGSEDVAQPAAELADDEYDDEAAPWLEQFYDEPADELEIYAAEHIEDGEDDEARDAGVQLYFDEPPFVTSEQEDDALDDAAELLAAIAERVILDEGIIQHLVELSDDDESEEGPDDYLPSLADVPAEDDMVAALGASWETDDDEREYEPEPCEAAPSASIDAADWIIRARRRGRR